MFFNEAEKNQRPNLKEPDIEEITYKRKRSRGINNKKFESPPVEIIEYDIAEYEKKVLPKSNLGKAIRYCLNQWEKLKVYLEDGEIELSNNKAERAVKPFIIGRKNWLFSKSPHGAKASSIVETAKANSLVP